VDINESDSSTLMQIPGIDADTAEQLMNGRTYESSNAFLAKLTEIAPNVDAALAAAYLTAN
jgi:radical SAM superfamily enzyme with C-terminal helix-hairpin-helix motif